MDLRHIRFSGIMFTAGAMSAAVAHWLELPAKRRYEKEQYVTLHRTLYGNFGRVGGIAEASAVAATGGLALWLRGRRRAAIPLTAVAAGCLAANWPLDAIPPDWRRWRDQWEYAHAVRALLITAALTALVASVLRETSGEIESRV